MNPRRNPSKVIRITERAFDELVEIGLEFGVKKRDVVDAIVEDYLIRCRKDKNLKFRVFQGFASRMNIKTKTPPAGVKKGRGPEKPTEGGHGGGTPSVPEWMLPGD